MDFPDRAQGGSDKVGLRFVVLLTSDVRLVGEAIKQCNFVVSKDRDYEAERDRKPLEFSYQSDHFIVRAASQIVSNGWTFPAGIACEVQVRTLLQHAHSELTHDRIYKGTGETPPKIARTVAKSMALIETTDDFFTKVLADLDELDRPTKELLEGLAALYTNATGKTQLQRSSIIIIEALRGIIQGDALAASNNLLADKAFIGARMAAKSTSNHLLRQPAMIMAYLAVSQSPAETKAAWPFYT